MVNSHKKIEKSQIRIIFVHYIVSVSLWCCKKIAHIKCQLKWVVTIFVSYEHVAKLILHGQYTSCPINEEVMVWQWVIVFNF